MVGDDSRILTNHWPYGAIIRPVEIIPPDTGITDRTALASLRPAEGLKNVVLISSSFAPLVIAEALIAFIARWFQIETLSSPGR
jgi:hypothetical protein